MRERSIPYASGRGYQEPRTDDVVIESMNTDCKCPKVLLINKTIIRTRKGVKSPMSDVRNLRLVCTGTDGPNEGAGSDVPFDATS